MDELIEKIDSTGIQSTFEDLYKNKGRPGGQESRRQELLEQQKQNRNNSLDKLRGILNSSSSSGSVKWGKKPAPYRYRPVLNMNGSEVNYKDVLMFSEWMVEKPRDFGRRWYIVPCPKGTRMLAIAKDGYTSFYSKFGQFRFECSTGLPGGNLYDYSKNDHCVVDGVYVHKNNTFYLLDVMVWNCQEVTYGQTEYRHFWLETNITYNSDVTSLQKKNEVRFILLPKVSCEYHSLNEYLAKYPPFHNNFPELDGFLFYHRYAFYSSGMTPLVGWLYSYMLPEVLGEEYKMHPKYLTKPKGYKDQATFIEKYEEKNKKKKKCKKRRDNIDYCISPEPQESYYEYIMTYKWLLAKPDNLETHYFMVPIPKGIKMMAVASYGSTRFYNKYGFLEFERETSLPGGNNLTLEETRELCILDGFYVPGNNTFYILDMLGWNSFDIFTAVADYRNYWLHQNLDVYPSIRELTHMNQVIFSVLPKLGTKQIDLITYLTKYPAFEGGFPELDLLAFIEKSQLYLPGENLAVLHPFMIPEVLGCHYMIHEEYMKATPRDYINRYAYVQSNSEFKIINMTKHVLWLNKLKKKYTPRIYRDVVSGMAPNFKILEEEAKKQKPVSILEELLQYPTAAYPYYYGEFTCRSHVSDEKMSEHSFEDHNYHMHWSSPVNEINGSSLMELSNVDEEVAADVVTEETNAADPTEGAEADPNEKTESYEKAEPNEKAKSKEESESDEEAESDEESESNEEAETTEVAEESKKDEPTEATKEYGQTEVADGTETQRGTETPVATELVEPCKAAEASEIEEDTLNSSDELRQPLPKKPKIGKGSIKK